MNDIDPVVNPILPKSREPLQSPLLPSMPWKVRECSYNDFSDKINVVYSVGRIETQIEI